MGHALTHLLDHTEVMVSGRGHNGLVGDAQHLALLCQPLQQGSHRTADAAAHAGVQAIDTLSGGNKQKVVVGRLLAHRLSVYLFDEIAEGVDIASRKTLFRFVRDEVSRDSAVLMASNVVSDLMEVCDRILVMFNGRITLEIPREDFDEHEIYRAIQGLNTRLSSVEISKEEIK